MVSDKINISIVIVNYNSTDYLEQSIKSIEDASCSLNVEIIVVDNNSSDNPSFSKIKKFKNLRLIELSENIGFGKANNIGASFATGEYILVLNPDTVLDKETLNVMFNYMENHKEVGASGCKVINSDGTFQVACRRGFPTPWVSFTKLFGFQRFFPHSKLFARYNQTFRSIDETYYIDSVIGAFMFIRKEVWDKVSGFDENYFMYGEDLDLCYRISKSGWKISYVHSATIIHYKGVSTRRSSIDELEHFYSAMSIFSKKYFSNSVIFLFFLRSGIWLRKQLARLIMNKVGFFIFLFDVLSVNFSLALATKIRFGGFFNFPAYAYPDVFIVISLILIITMIAVGEYLEGKHSVGKSIQSLLITFFLLSSLTYFFKDFAFSRGVVLMTIGFTIALTTLLRVIIDLYANIKGKNSQRRLAIIGTGANMANLFISIKNISSINTEIIGFVVTTKHNTKELPAPVIGSFEYLDKIIVENDINEIVIADDSINSTDIFAGMAGLSKRNIRFHFVKEFNDFIVSGIINDIEGNHIKKQSINLSKLKFRIIKRTIDITLSFLLLSFGLPFIAIFFKRKKTLIYNIFHVLIGKLTFIGIYGNEISTRFCRQGLMSLAGLGNPEFISPETIKKLNNYYLVNYSLILDLEILFKYILRKKHGN